MDKAALERLEQSALVYAGDRPGLYRFKHGVTRDVVYDSVRLVERRRLHAAIASAIEAKAGDAAVALHCESLAYHYSGAAKPSRAAKYAELAGDRALSSSSLDRPRQHYRSALSELERLPSSSQKRDRWLAISRKWAAACVFSPAPEQLETLSRALEYSEELADQSAIAHSHYWLGWIHYALGEQERATLHTEHALSMLGRDSDSKLVGQLLANLGQIHTVAGDPGAALRCLTRAVEIKRAHIRNEGDAPATRAENVPVGFAYALGCQGLVHGYLGNFVEAHQRIDAALELVAGSCHAIEASLLGLLGMVQLWQGAYRRCVDTAARMRAAAERVRGPYVFAMSQTIGGLCTLDPGARSESAGRAARCGRLARTTSDAPAHVLRLLLRRRSARRRRTARHRARLRHPGARARGATRPARRSHGSACAGALPGGGCSRHGDLARAAGRRCHARPGARLSARIGARPARSGAALLSTRRPHARNGAGSRGRGGIPRHGDGLAHAAGRAAVCPMMSLRAR